MSADLYDTKALCGAVTRRGYNMTTASGKPFWPSDPRPQDIRISDIAAHLSRICRFNGAIKDDIDVYSVAQHSVLVERYFTIFNPNSSTNARLAALLHDAAEAYLGDMIKPIKDSYAERKAHEARVSRVIEQRFGLRPKSLDDPRIKVQDYRAVLTEHRDLQVDTGEVDWGLDHALAGPWEETIIPVGTGEARDMFLERFAELYGAEDGK